MSSRSGVKRADTRPGYAYWKAKRPEECVACPDPIEVGQEIMKAYAGGYVHVICPHLSRS